MCEIFFIAQDSYSHQYLLEKKQAVYKRRQSPARVLDNATEDSVLMDAAFTAQGYGSYSYWIRYYQRRAAGFEFWLRALWEKNSPDIVVIWNGMWHYEKLAERVAIEKGIQTVFMENGYFPGTAHIDPVGVNAKAEIRGLSWDKLAADVTEDSLIDFMKQLRSSFGELKRYSQADDLVNTLSFFRKGLVLGEVLFCDIPFIFFEFISKLKIHLKAKRRRKVQHSDEPLPKRYLFLPLQVAHDSQLILNSPWIHSPQEVIEAVVEAAAVLDQTLTVVVKEHPMEDAQICFRGVREKYPAIHWASRGSLEELVQGAEFVVNVNSSVGFHALLFGTPVVCLGTSLYARAGLAFACLKKEMLVDVMRKALEEDVDWRLVARFALTLHKEYCVPYTRGAIQKNDVKAACAFLCQRYIGQLSGQ